MEFSPYLKRDIKKQKHTYREFHPKIQKISIFKKNNINIPNCVNYYVKTEIAICQEFSNKIHYKESEKSILVLVDNVYFEDLKNQLDKLDYKVISKTGQQNSSLVEFVKIHKVY
jgi:ribosome-associated toxin RatA of RatAB toxin-antitoxin module